jgi:hypothetical protein
MKRFVFLVLFLFACETQEFPPEPSRPGEAAVGMALGGIPIGAFPSWAAPLKYTDITPEFVKSGDSIKITVNRPASDSRELYIFSTMYEFDRQYNVWSQRFSEASQSGILKGNKWHMNKAVFSVPVNSQRFPPGLNYVVVYWCADNGYNAQGRKLWDCNGAKWLLGAFEQVGFCGDNFVSSNEICDPPGGSCSPNLLTAQNISASIISTQTAQISVIGSQTSVKPSLGSSVQYVCANDCKSCVPTQTPIQICGNNKLEIGEDCEPPYNPASALPPTSAIYACATINGTNGFCNQNCSCIPMKEEQPPVQQYCGNNVKDVGEECDGPSTTPANAVCANCTIVCDPGFMRQGDLCVQQTVGHIYPCPPLWTDASGNEASFALQYWSTAYQIKRLNAAGQPVTFATVYPVQPWKQVVDSTDLRVVFASDQRDLFGTLVSQQHNYPNRQGLLFESNPFASGKADYLLLTVKKREPLRVEICWKAAHDYPINKPTVT